MDYLEQAKKKAQEWECANSPAPETIAMVQGYALIAIVEALRETNEYLNELSVRIEAAAMDASPPPSW